MAGLGLRTLLAGAKSSMFFCFFVRHLLKARVCDNDFAIKALKCENNFDTV